MVMAPSQPPYTHCSFTFQSPASAKTAGMDAEMLMEHGAHLSLVPEEEIPDQPDPALYSESAMLTSKMVLSGDPAPDTVTIRAYISYNGASAKIKVGVDDGMPADVTLYSAAIRYLPARTAAARFITWLPAVWLAVLVVLFILDRKKNAGKESTGKESGSRLRENAPAVICLAAIAFLSCLPVLTGRVPDGSDLRFHYYRIYSIAEGISAGVFPVRIQSGWMNGFGYANGIFYPDAMLYLPAILYCLGIRMDRAYMVMAVFIQCLTAVLSYLGFYGIARSRSGRNIARFAALCGSALYTMSLPLLYNLFSMAGVGAAAASAFAPLVLIGMHSIYRNGQADSPAEGRLKGPALLALGMAGMLSNHLMSFLFAFVFLLVYALMCGRRTFRKDTLTGILAAALMAAAATAFVWLPFITERLSMSDMRGSERHWRLMDNAATPAELFATAYSVNTTEFRINVTGLLNAPTRGLGVMSLLILVITACILVRMHGRGKDDPDDRMGRLLGCFVLTLLIILVSSTWMPYDAVKAYLPGVYGVIEKIQFPLRVHPAASLLIAYMAVQDILLVPELDIPAGKDTAAKAAACTAAAFITVLAVLQGTGYLSQYNNETAPFRYAARMQDLKNYVSGGEYLPAYFDPQATLVPDEGLYDTSAVSAKIISRGYNSISMHVENRAGLPARVVFPLTYYPGYRVRAVEDGQAAAAASRVEMDEKTQRASAVVPAGFAGTVTVYFREPWYWKAAWLVSAAAVVWMLAVLFRKNKGS